VKCCRDGCPSGRFSHLYRGTLELRQSDHRVLGLLPDQGPPPIAQFGQVARVLVVPNFHLRMMEATVFLGTFNATDIFGTLSEICASTQSCLGALRTIPSTSWLDFCSGMHCELWDLISVCISKSCPINWILPAFALAPPPVQLRHSTSPAMLLPNLLLVNTLHS
jgi:hypothetical protein